MNNLRRAALKEIKAKIESIIKDLAILQDAEQAALDNMPESLRMSENASAAEDAVAEIDSAFSSLDDAVFSLEGILDYRNRP